MLAACSAALVATWSAVPSAASGEPSPSILGANLSIAVPWGLGEDPHAGLGPILYVGAPMPFGAQLYDTGGDKLYMYVVRRVAPGSVCPEDPAAVAAPVAALTGPEGDRVSQAEHYEPTYVWVPSEPGEYALCGYLDTSASGPVAVRNFLNLSVEASPGTLAFSSGVAADGRTVLTVSGEAPAPSELTVEQLSPGAPCTDSQGRPAGLALPAKEGEDVEGAFARAYTTFAGPPGIYEVCAELIPRTTSEQFFWRPYKLASSNFVLAGGPEEPVPTERAESGPPRLSGVTMTRSRFRSASRGGRVAERSSRGSAFRFRLSAPATVSIQISRLLEASRAPLCSHAAAKGRTCVRARPLSVLQRRAQAGPGTVPFSGVLAGRTLAPGSYEARIVARNASGASRQISLRFTILR